MSTLPSELYRCVIEHVDNQSDLFRLSLVSCEFNYEAERCLYKNISLTWIKGRPLPAQDDHIFKIEALLRYLLQSSRGSLQHFLVDLDLDKLGKLGFSAKDWANFSPLLSLCANLKTLRLRTANTYGFIPSPDASFRLRTFSFAEYWGHNISAADDAALCRFLASQPDIRELRTGLPLPLRNVVPGSLPLLEVLSGYLTFCSPLFSDGRPIHDLTLLPDFEKSLVAPIPEDMSSLRRLIVPAFEIEALSIFENIYDIIEHIEVTLLFPEDIDILQHAVLSMYSLQSIRVRTLRVYGVDGPNTILRLVNQRVDGFLPQLQDSCPSLLSHNIACDLDMRYDEEGY